MGESGHESACVKFVDLLLKQADAHHLPVHVDPFVCLHRGIRARLELGCCHGHFEIPDIRASTSNMQAKSNFSIPMPRAAVRNSLLIAVVGKGTFSCRPNSIARTMSFCIMFTSNQASSGCLSTNGPRYWIMGDATALCVRTSTATSRAIPLFSASSTPSEKASICTARLKLVAIFIDKATPLSPTYVTLGPISCSSGFTFSKVSRRPPTITDNFPSCRVMTLPDTGESTMSAPRSRTFAARARLTLGLTVLMSRKILPGPRPASIPSEPSAIAEMAAALVTMAKVKSDAEATARGESSHFMPLSISHCAFERVRLYPVRV